MDCQFVNFFWLVIVISDANSICTSYFVLFCCSAHSSVNVSPLNMMYLVSFYELPS